MTREKLRGVIYLGTFIGIIGLIALFSSVYFGSSLASTWLSNQGSADTSTYLVILESYINIFLVVGGILMGFGLFLVVFTYFKLHNCNKEDLS
ncbi:hypothetical protein GH741_17820 [Aquibacillus halophilus]|uniref:Uncharacterized protein n=1 Tax=Aquibacillus halophilus TaxID=930132 RepID=A0A6A8DJ58_9BACI|nr:hypothetical protein [Aquibacillus halophilus]MRH44506.1 hypothetical protein [Aquibacillus halophilus]